MLINKKINNDDVSIGDVFRFKASEIDNIRMEQAFLGFSLEEKEIDNIYLHVLFAKDILNIVGINFLCEKNNIIVSEKYIESPAFINYVFSTVNNISKININDIPTFIKEQNGSFSEEHLNINMIGLGVKDSNGIELNYGDIIKLDYEKTKKFLNDDFLNLLESKNTQEIYIHLSDLNKDRFSEENRKYMTSLAYKIYAVSNSEFKNIFDEKDNQYAAKKYKETGDEKYKMPNEIHYDFTNPGFIRTLYKANAISEVIGNSKSYELDITDVKKDIKPQKPKLR